MRLSPEHHNRSRFIQATVFMVAIALTLTGIAGLATQAKAGPVSLTVDRAVISMGAFQDSKVIPATANFPSPSLPLPQRTDIVLNGTETNGQLSFPAALNSGIQFPYMSLPHPLIDDLLIPFTLRMGPAGLTGTYDDATGKTSLEGNLDLIVVTGTGANFPLPDALVDAAVPPLGLFARCRVANIPVKFTNDDQFPLNGQPFKGGFGVNGAIATGWDTLPDSVSENGGECDLVPLITNGSGGIWLSNGVETPTPQPIPVESCETDPNLCPDPAVKITALKVAPKKYTVKAGKVVRLKIKVTNSGDGDATRMKLGIKSSNKRVKVRKQIRMNVRAGSTRTRVISVRVTRKAKSHARITIKAGSRKASAKLRIKPVRKAAGRR